MNIILDKEVIDISQVESVTMRSITRDELAMIERQRNGEYISAQSAFSAQLFAKMVKITTENTGIILKRFPTPKLTRDDVEGHNPYQHEYERSLSSLGINVSEYHDSSATKGWEVFGDHKLTFVSTEFSDDGDASIEWRFAIWKPARGSDSMKQTKRMISLSQILPVLKELIDLPKPKNAWSSFWSDYSYKDIQATVRPAWEEYTKCKRRIDLRVETRDFFFNHNETKQVLCVKIHGESTEQTFVEDFCEFDIFEKENELRSRLDEYRNYQKKVDNSYNAGEKDVEHAIKWFLAAHNGYAVSIKGDCESRYRINCIQLHKPDFIDEPQEMDHILVCAAGVVIIETKHWKGNIDIRPDGKWTRKADDESATVGVDSPKFQMRRHEVLMQQILPTIPVHSLLCFSNASTIIDGRENFKDYSIITIDQLEETLTELCSKGTYSRKEIDGMVATIEAHKLYKA